MFAEGVEERRSRVLQFKLHLDELEERLRDAEATGRREEVPGLRVRVNYQRERLEAAKKFLSRGVQAQICYALIPGMVLRRFLRTSSTTASRKSTILCLCSE